MENIEKVKDIRLEFPKKYTDIDIKFVMVVFENDINERLKSIQKVSYWDEFRSDSGAIMNSLCLR